MEKNNDFYLKPEFKFVFEIKSNIFSFSIVTTDSFTLFIFTYLILNNFSLSSFKIKQKDD